MTEREDFLLLTIYEVRESLWYAEHERGIKLDTMRMFLDRVLDQLSPEQRADLHARSASALLNDEVRQPCESCGHYIGPDGTFPRCKSCHEKQ